jgi:hypothetical protein
VRLPKVGRAFAAGDIGAEHVGVLGKTLTEIPVGADRDAGEGILVELGG